MLSSRATRLDEQELSRNYHDRLSQFVTSLPPEWRTQDKRTSALTWRIFVPGDQVVPTQGWKVHLSIAAAEALDLVLVLAPALVKAEVSFKLPTSVEGIAALNYGQGGESQIGKILTVYPGSPQQAAAVAKALDRLRPRTRGPVVRSDLALRVGGAVSLRYGSFGAGAELLRDAIGRPAFVLQAPDGGSLKDEYRLDGAQAEFAPRLPLRLKAPPSYDIESEVVVGRRRYLPLTLLHRSALSRVSLGLDVASCDTVVIKQVRRGVGGDLRGFDAADKLENEHQVLRALAQHDGLAPRALGFAGGEESTLILEDLPGAPLHSLGRVERLESLPMLAAAVARLHAAGFAHRDIKLANALFAPGTVRLIDFGLAARLGSEWAALDGTQGYLPPEGAAGPASEAGDVFALGVCIAHALLGRDPGTLPSDAGRLVGLLHLIGANRCAKLVRRLTVADAGSRPSAAWCAAELAQQAELLAQEVADVGASRPSQSDVRWSLRVSAEAAAFTRRFLQPGEAGHAWRNNHFQSDFECEGINLGAAGIILGLSSIDHALGRRTFETDVQQGCEMLASRPPDAHSHGLFTGNAGVALALGVAARRLRRADLAQVAASRLRAASNQSEELDLFCGAAGVIWSGCMLGEVLAADWPLAVVDGLAEHLLDSADTREGVVVWPASRALDESDAPYTGAAHGSAGIAMALAIWSKRRGNARGLELSREAFASLFSALDPTLRAPLPRRIGAEPDPAPIFGWCHGVAGWLWCLLQVFDDEPELSSQLDRAVDLLANSPAVPLDNPTYCHGLSGHLELLRMLSGVTRHRQFAQTRIRSTRAALRALAQRSPGACYWASEEPRIVTPDLWIGFLAPASALALAAVGSQDALLSSSWLRQCTAESAGRP